MGSTLVLASLLCASAVLPEDDPPPTDPARLAELGSRVSWAADWEAAAERARAEGRLVLVVAFLYPGFSLTESPRATVFEEDSVVELVESCFVPFELSRTNGGAFTASYGLNEKAFGQALLLVTPDGEVLAETQHSTNPDLAYAFLRECLARHPRYRGAPIPEDVAPLDRARARIARGELEAALATLGEPESAEGWRLRAKALRLSWRGEEALAALERGREEGSRDGWLEELRLRMRVDQLSEARAVLDTHLPGEEDPDVRGEALLIGGLLHLHGGSADDARASWERAIAELPETTWAVRCAALLESGLIELDVRPSFGWPSARLLDELRAFPETTAPRSLDAAREGALAWLLEHQLEDGSWGNFAQSDPTPELGPSPFSDSSAALAVRALLRHTEHEGAEDAARRALEYLVGSVREREATPPRVFYMDYMTWSDAMMLEAFVDATEAGLVEAAAVEETVATLVADLAGRQQEGGGWSYYVTGDLAAESSMPPHCMSFTTAAGAIALGRVRAAGFAVPDEALDPAVGALVDMREEDGLFPYFHFPGVEGNPIAADTPGEVGRGPACELALFVNGKSDGDRIARALELFFEYSPTYAAERGKVLMHAGRDGQGCHYLFFDYAHAALAAERIPPDPETRARITELVLDCRQPDGSFLDTPILGRPYGTAMALIALAALDA